MKHESDHIIKIGDVDEPGLIEISNSRLKKFRSCQKAHDYKYVMKLRPKRTAVPLRKGSWVHSCLEARAKGEDWVELLKKKKAEEYNILFEEEKAELGDLPNDVLRMMRSYIQTWKDVDAEYEVVVAEQDFKIRIDGTPFVLVGIIDLILRHKATGQIWCMEHKTMKNTIPTEQFRITDVQTAMYEKVMEYLAPYLGYKPSDVGGIIFDYIKTKPPTIPEVLKNGGLSRRANIDCDRYTYEACIKRAGLNVADYEDFMAANLDNNKFFARIPMAKSGKMINQLFKEVLDTAIQIENISGVCPVRNLNFTCDRPKCEFRDLCLAELQGLDIDTLINMMYTKEEEKDGEEREGDESDN